MKTLDKIKVTVTVYPDDGWHPSFAHGYMKGICENRIDITLIEQGFTLIVSKGDSRNEWIKSLEEFFMVDYQLIG